MDRTVTSAGFDEAKLAAVGPMLQGVVDAGDLSGAVTLVWRKGEIVRLDAVGKRDREHNLPMQRDTLFRIASMTKPITSVAVMMLIEEGKLALDTPIAKWLPEFSDMRVLRDPQGPLDDTTPSPRAITVEDLLTHRSGLAYNFTSIGPIGKAYEDALGDVLDVPHGPDEWLKRLGRLPLSYAPGERFHYSHATEVLGYLIGRVTGKSYRDFLMERILGPLGMKDTDFYVPKEKRSRAAVMYQQDEGALKVVPLRQYDEPPAFTGGGGGLTSTLDDYLSFARMLLNGGEIDGTALSQARDGRADARQPAQRGTARDPVPRPAVLGGRGLRPRPLRRARSREARLDGRGLERLLRLARRVRNMVAGRPGEGHDPDVPDPELHAADLGHRPCGPRRHRRAPGLPDVPEGRLWRADGVKLPSSPVLTGEVAREQSERAGGGNSPSASLRSAPPP